MKHIYTRVQMKKKNILKKQITYLIVYIREDTLIKGEGKEQKEKEKQEKQEKQKEQEEPN